MSKIETIQHAAIKRSDGIISIGKSHSDIIKNAPFGTCKAGSEQGFITSENKFVNRIESTKIAIKAKQAKKEDIKSCGLLSENIWSDNNFKYDSKKGYYLLKRKI